MQNMMNSPEFANRMSQIMADPTIMDQVARMTGQELPPHVRQMMQSPQFRQMLYVSVSQVLFGNELILREQVQSGHIARDASIRVDDARCWCWCWCWWIGGPPLRRTW